MTTRLSSKGGSGSDGQPGLGMCWPGVRTAR